MIDQAAESAQFPAREGLAANSNKDQLKNSEEPVGSHVQFQNFCLWYDANIRQ